MSSEPQSDQVLLEHIRQCIERIHEYTGRERTAFYASPLIQDAVARNLHTLAESSQRLSNMIKETEPSIPWRAIAGFRNVLVHGYPGIDLDLVWSVVERDLPDLADAIERMARFPGSSR